MKKTFTLRNGLLMAFFLTLSSQGYSQQVGDYRTNGANQNYNSKPGFDRWNGSAWSLAYYAPGSGTLTLQQTADVSAGNATATITGTDTSYGLIRANQFATLASTLPVGTTVSSVSGSTITLSKNSLLTGSASLLSFAEQITYAGTNTISTNTYTLSGAAVGGGDAILPGMAFTSGANIPAGTTVSSVAGDVITLSNSTTAAITTGVFFTKETTAATTAGSTTITLAAPNSLVTVGMNVFNSLSIPYGSKVVSVSGTTVVLSMPATATYAGVGVVFGYNNIPNFYVNHNVLCNANSATSTIGNVFVNNQNGSATAGIFNISDGTTSTITPFGTYAYALNPVITVGNNGGAINFVCRTLTIAPGSKAITNQTVTGNYIHNLIINGGEGGNAITNNGIIDFISLTAGLHRTNISFATPGTTTITGSGTTNIYNAFNIPFSGTGITLASGVNISIAGAFTTNGSLTIENNANLVQNTGSTYTGSGTAIVKRNSNLLKRLDYTLWSSPVTGTQTLTEFSPLTSQSPISRFATYDTSANAYAPIATPTTTTFSAGAGYLIRMPNTADAVTPTAYPGVFTGTSLNNGNVPVALSTAGSTYNLVGNPYPSTINLFTLQSNNSTIIGSTFYMWRGTNGVGSAYCSYLPTSTSTGTYVSNGNLQAPVTFTGDILSGQGFFVSATTTGPLVFNNGQRVTTASSFFKTKQVATADKVWLNATTAAGAFSQMAVTYFDGATQGVDAFDGKYINDSAFALTSNINNGEYTIQGRPAFDASDIVALNFKTDAIGDYTIAIDHSEGVFATGQDVYLLDSKTGTETNLKAGAYNFTAAAGVDNSRFSLKYQKTLKVGDSALNYNTVIVYKNKGTLYVNSSAKAISSIKVYDVQGRLLAEQKNVKANTATISNLKASNQILIVRVTGEDNSEVTKKIAN